MTKQPAGFETLLFPGIIRTGSQLVSHIASMATEKNAPSSRTILMKNLRWQNKKSLLKLGTVRSSSPIPSIANEDLEFYSKIHKKFCRGFLLISTKNFYYYFFLLR